MGTVCDYDLILTWQINPWGSNVLPEPDEPFIRLSILPSILPTILPTDEPSILPEPDEFIC
mgnify:CR=1 FL=1